MSDGLGVSLTFILEMILFGLINYYTVKLTSKNVKKRIWGGIIFLLLTRLSFSARFFSLGFGMKAAGVQEFLLSSSQAFIF